MPAFRFHFTETIEKPEFLSAVFQQIKSTGPLSTLLWLFSLLLHAVALLTTVVHKYMNTQISTSL